MLTTLLLLQSGYLRLCALQLAGKRGRAEQGSVLPSAAPDTRHHGKTHSALIGDFLLEAQQKILKAIPWGDEAWDRYWVTETKIMNRKVKVTMVTDTDEDGEISGV